MQPFNKHPADAGALAGCGSGLLGQAGGALTQADQTRQAYAPALDNWSGMCAPALSAAQAPLAASAQAVNAALVWAGTVVQFWGTRVNAFNDKVDEIVADLHSRGPTFGAGGTGGEPPTAQQVDAARAVAVNAAKRLWWQAYDTYIGDGGDRVASMLSQGPTPANVNAVDSAGLGDDLRRALNRTFSPFGPLLPGVTSVPFLPFPFDLAGPNSDASASAGLTGQDGQFGPHFSASAAANLITLRQQIQDAMSTVDLTAGLGGHAGGHAGADIGPNGIHAGAGVDAFVGVDATATGTLGDPDVVQIKPSVSGRFGAGVDAGAGVDIDEDGVHIGAHGGAALGPGGSVHIDTTVDVIGTARAIDEAPDTIDKIIDLFD